MQSTYPGIIYQVYVPFLVINSCEYDLIVTVKRPVIYMRELCSCNFDGREFSLTKIKEILSMVQMPIRYYD